MVGTVKEELEKMSPAERDGILLENAAAEINADKGQKKAEAKPVKKVTKKSAEPNSKNESSNAKKSNEEKILEKWLAFVNKNRLGFRKAGTEDVYLKVEAWNYLFALCKITPTILDISRVEGGDENDETLYIAKAGLMPLSKELTEVVPIGTTAFGACKVGEGLFKDDFSALSMAQTRAIGKLGRVAYAHLAIACGFKATPLEEMDFEGNGNK